NGQGAIGQAYLPLAFTNSSGLNYGIENPGKFLANGMQAGSPLNTVFDTTLAALFTTNLNVKLKSGVDGNTYTGAPTTVGGKNVLQFTGPGGTFQVFDPRTPRVNPANESSGAMVFAN